MLLAVSATECEADGLCQVRTCDAVMANAYKAVEVSSINYIGSEGKGPKGYMLAFAPTQANLSIG